MMYPLVLELAGRQAPVRVPVAVICRVLGFSRQAFYQWCVKPVSDRDWEEAHLVNAAWDVHAEEPTFGYRLFHDQLVHEQGLVASETRVGRLCSENRILSVIHHRRGTGKKVAPPVHDDHVRRDFTATGPNRLWLTDNTEHHTSEGKLYLCAVKDVSSNRIVGYSIDSPMKAALAVDTLTAAIN